ncbi:CPBP family intramembrane glutamic endopeptidase [Mucilaginibacter aquatilis]|uniref:CPBP family intramembrane metalloprotease n=1 Tax=Mucilaginibacter aquatilis TaxID=1517760 RepID=A0A6I4I550_9SPHI|nr:CPBP family intramembrane glutamic endopeptidase [Mucilaginibacter aquatilis]MVN90202.1 CPBP family intramembrane metalloprotease [Mucilaginibacter aquatilis]
MISKKPYYKQEFGPALQFAAFIGITIALLLLGNIIALAFIAVKYGANGLMEFVSIDLTSPIVTQNLWILQVAGTTIPILLIPIVFAKLLTRQPSNYLKVSASFPSMLMLIVLATMVVSMPFMETLININRKMVLPEFLKGLEDALRRAEDSAQKVTAVLLKMDSLADMFKALILVALVTAIAEELMFRGCLQTIFLQWTNSIHWAVWITAALFSAFHMEFYGFLPRLMLGVLFGYFTVWSGSIWPAVWGHFLNNGTAVVLTYLYQHKKIDINPDAQHAFNYFLPVLSAAFTLTLLLGYRWVANRKTIADSV